MPSAEASSRFPFRPRGLQYLVGSPSPTVPSGQRSGLLHFLGLSRFLFIQFSFLRKTLLGVYGHFWFGFASFACHLPSLFFSSPFFFFFFSYCASMVYGSDSPEGSRSRSPFFSVGFILTLVLDFASVVRACPFNQNQRCFFFLFFCFALLVDAQEWANHICFSGVETDSVAICHSVTRLLRILGPLATLGRLHQAVSVVGVARQHLKPLRAPTRTCKRVVRKKEADNAKPCLGSIVSLYVLVKS